MNLLTSAQAVMSIPVDILLEILQETSRSELPTLCRVSRSFRHHAADFLYRDISSPNILDVCTTLTRSPELAARVKHFEVSRPSITLFILDDSKFVLIRDALRCLSNLRSLSLRFPGRYSWILEGCTFRIEHFFCSIACDDGLVRFLNGQPELTTIRLSCPCIGLHIPATCVPRLTKIQARISWLVELIPGRSIKEVIFDQDFVNSPGPIDISFLTSSLSSIRTLFIGSPSLRAQTPTQIASFIPAIEALTIKEPHISISLHDADTQSLMEWLRDLLPVLPNLRSATLITRYKSFMWSDEDELEFLEDVTRLASSMLKTFTLDYPYYPSVCTTWIRVGNAWIISHRDRQEPTIERRLELEREAWKQKCMAEIAAHYQFSGSSSTQKVA